MTWYNYALIMTIELHIKVKAWDFELNWIKILHTLSADSHMAFTHALNTDIIFPWISKEGFLIQSIQQGYSPFYVMYLLNLTKTSHLYVWSFSIFYLLKTGIILELSLLDLSSSLSSRSSESYLNMQKHQLKGKWNKKHFTFGCRFLKTYRYFICFSQNYQM